MSQRPRFLALAALSAIAAAALALFGTQSVMSTPRTPLVMKNGRITQLPSTDSIAGTIIGCGSGSAMQSMDANGSATCVSTGGGGTGTVTSVATASPLAGGPITGSGTVSLNTGTGLATSGGNLIVDETREQRRVTGACTSPNAIDTVNSDGTVVCSTGVLNTGNVSGTTNRAAKFTGTNTVGNANPTDDGTTWTFSEAVADTAPSAATGIAISQTHTGQAASPIGLSYVDSTATATSTTDSYGIKVVTSTACTAGDCPRINYGIYSSATNPTNAANAIALLADRGDVVLNNTSGGTFVKGLLTLTGGLTGFTTTTCPTGSRVSAVATDGTATCTAIFDPTTSVTYFSDFLNNVTPTGTIADGTFTAVFTGTSSGINQITDEVGHPGIVRMVSGSTTTGRAALITGSNSSETFIFGTGAFSSDMLVRPGTLCDNATNICTMACGFLDSVTTADSTDGVYLKFDPATSSNWRTVTENNATKSEADTSPAKAPTASTWTHLGIAVNAAGTSATFTVDGAAAGTVATNIPIGTGRAFGFGCMILKSAGTTSRSLDLDYLRMDITGLSR